MSIMQRAFGLMLGAAAPLAAVAQVTSYDAQSMVVAIPSVSVGSSGFTSVTLKNRGDFVFDLTGFVEQRVAAPGLASYDLATGILTVPAVKVGAATFLDVKLLNVGGYAFTLQAATALGANVSAEVDAFARAIEQQTDTTLPANGNSRLALADSCWAHNGRTRANWIADYDANLTEFAKRDAYLIGRKVQNVQVLGLRNLANADGSTRREIDVQWDVVYRDGSTARGEKSTLLSGSSAGTPRCTTPQTGSHLRFKGNQQLVQTAVRAANVRDERYSVANGAALSPLVIYQRRIHFHIADPMGNATYVIVTGPGPTSTIAGVGHPFSMKLLSPRLQRSAPELLGKTGNFLNWADDASFRKCLLGSAVPVVHIVDCVAQGAAGDSWGVSSTTAPDAAADQSFTNQGWIAGGDYRFDVYNDDGWKTVNGHAGNRPIATYYPTLDRLPYTFAQMINSYPVIKVVAMTGSQFAANATSAAPTPLSLGWTLPTLQADGRVHHLFQGWEYHDGAKIGNSPGVLNPGYRNFNRYYPGTTALSATSFPVTPPVLDQNGKRYTEYLLFFSEPGTLNSIQSSISLQ